MIALVAVMVAASRYLWLYLQPEPPTSSTVESGFAYRIDDLTLKLLDAGGRQRLQISSPRLTDRGEAYSTRLEHPEITTGHTTGDDRWLITADYGLLDRRQRHVELYENVVVQSLNRPKPLQLHTAYLRMEIDQRTIHSEKLVTITQPGLQLQGVGLFGNVEQGNYRLEHNVHAIYDTK